MKTTFVITFVTSLLCILTTFAQEPAKVVVNGLGGDVTVRRDGRSIPYIEAKTDRDLYFTQGYVTASDRLFQMDLLRRVARGETAEIFGRQALEEDKRWRRFNFAKISEQNLQFLSAELRTALDSYANGVNAYIATLDAASMPSEFRILQYRPRNWTAADTIVVGKILSDALSSTWRHDLIRLSLQGMDRQKLADITDGVTPFDLILFGSDGKAKTVGEMTSGQESNGLIAAADADEKIRQRSMERVGLYAEGLAASNNWVIAGKLTADGKPILANDPHLSPTAPGIWYLTHLSTPSMRVSGVTFPGVPGIILGHNEDIAWGATNVGPDVQDLYLETFNEKGEFKSPTGWKPATVRKETIQVRTNPLKPETEVVLFEVIETGNGPVIVEEGAKKYALKWTAFDPKNTEFDAFYRWNRARNWEDFKAALKTYGGAAQNFIYADTKGNIGWYAASRIPIRRTGDGAMPYDGSTAAGDWTGFIPFEELPNLYNPASGLIVTANQRIVGTSYKYPQMSRDAAPPWRARRIYDELTSRKKITMDDVRDVQHDSYSLPLVELSKRMIQANAASAETLAILKEWDGKMTPTARGAVLANEIRNCAANKIAEANQPAPAFIIRERVFDLAVRENLARWLPSKFNSYADLLRGCDAEVRTSLAAANRLGPDPATWTWGRVWQSRFSHPLGVVPLIGQQFMGPAVAIDGSGLTPNVGSGVSMRHIASPGNWDATRHVIPLGQSGNPASPHYKDQFEAWRTGSPAIFPFSKIAVAKSTVSSTVFAPK